jgi:hypothetical protein
MSKINICDLTTSNESGLVEIKDNSSVLKSVCGGDVISEIGSSLSAITRQTRDFYLQHR